MEDLEATEEPIERDVHRAMKLAFYPLRTTTPLLYCTELIWQYLRERKLALLGYGSLFGSGLAYREHR